MDPGCETDGQNPYIGPIESAPRPDYNAPRNKRCGFALLAADSTAPQGGAAQASPPWSSAARAPRPKAQALQLSISGSWRALT